MRTDLDHLPEAKRRELERIVQILFEEFEAATATRSHAHRRNGRILKVILFGSFARGDWVADPVGGYFSDYDLLVVVDHDDLTEVQEYWAKADDRLVRETTITKRVSAPVNFIVHSLADVNDQLRRGRYFFRDIVKDGVALYEAPDHPFDAVRDLTPAEALAETQVYFGKWMPSAAAFLSMSRHAQSESNPNEAAFAMHQAVERLYHCALLVLTLYSPKSHRLNFLRSQTESLEPRLAQAWPRGSKRERRCFELLRRAYVEARYSPHYKISAAELEWLGERVAQLQDLVRDICEERLAELKRAS